MMREAHENRPSGSNRIDPKDYAFSEETIEALTQLALLVRDIERQQEAEKSASKAANPHHHDHCPPPGQKNIARDPERRIP